MRFLITAVGSLALALAAFGQINATTLRTKYGTPLKDGAPASTETFKVRGNLEILVYYGPGGQACRIDLPRRVPVGRHASVDAETKRQLREVLDELVPLSVRGKEGSSMYIATGLPTFSITEYENLTITEAEPTTSFKVTFKDESCGPPPTQ